MASRRLGILPRGWGAHVVILGVWACLLLFTSRAAAVDIAVSGSWTRTIGPPDLVTGAGSDLRGDYDNLAGSVTITIANSGGRSWRVDVRQQDTLWPAGWTLQVRRTGAGSGGIVNGGEVYLAVSPTDVPFFTGSGDAGDVPIQVRLSGVSVQVPSGVYSTTLVYTVVES